MYATAMLVRDPTNQESVSLSLYSHRLEPLAPFGDIEKIATSSPGEHVFSIGSGHGRSVLAWIDVAASEQTSIEQITGLLSKLAVGAGEYSSQHVMKDPPLSARFQSVSGRAKHAAGDLERLRRELVAFLESAERGPVSSRDAIEIFVSRDDAGLRLELSEDARQKLYRVRPGAVARTLRVSEDNLAALDQSTVDLGALVESMTGLSLPALNQLGGVAVKRASDQRLLWSSKA
jgi:hypothetical protein